MRNQSFLLCQKSSHSSLDYQKTTKNMESHHRKPTGQISFPRLKTSLAFMRELTIFPFSAKHMSLTKYGWCPRASHSALCTSSATEWRLGPPHSLGRKRKQYWGPIPTPTMCSPSVPSASLSSSWSTVPTPEILPPPCPHLPPSLLFSKTGIILHIFFPSPKIGKRREQLIWSSWCFCYLTKISFAVILSLVVPHICTASFYLSPALPPLRGTISSSAAGIQSAEGTPSQQCPGPAGMFTSFRVHIVGPSLLSVSFSTSHSR